MKALITAALLSFLALPALAQEIPPDVASGVLTVSGHLAMPGPEGSGNVLVTMRSHRWIALGQQGADDCQEIANPDATSEFKAEAQKRIASTFLYLTHALSGSFTFSCRANTLNEVEIEHAGVEFEAAPPAE